MTRADQRSHRFGEVASQPDPMPRPAKTIRSGTSTRKARQGEPLQCDHARIVKAIRTIEVNANGAATTSRRRIEAKLKDCIAGLCSAPLDRAPTWLQFCANPL